MDLLTDEQAAAYLGIKRQTLAVWRTTGRYGLRFCKVGRSVRYHRSDLEAFINARSGVSTAAIKSHHDLATN